ncbi:MAG: hypothetical protein AAF488_12505 [Planctomycetota bacterium]
MFPLKVLSGSVSLLALLIWGLPCSAQDVLVYDVSSQLRSREAAIQSGYTVTAATSGVAFVDEIQTGTWDLISIDIPSGGMDVSISDAVAAYVAAGGKAMIGYWDLDGGAIGTPLRVAFQIDSATDYTTPLEVFAWDAAHPIFTSPNPITGPIVPTLNPWADDGDRLIAAAGAVEVGGFTATEALGEAAIVIGNNNTTIANGFVYDSFDAAEIIPLLQNEMSFLINGGVVAGPEFRRGDVNDDAVFDVSDMVFALASLFIVGSDAPPCESAADLNDDGVFDVSDTVYGLASLFIPGAPLPPAPAAACGEDPTDDPLECLASSVCP